MKGKSIAEVLLVFAFFEIAIIAYKPTELARSEANALGWSYLVGFLVILIPVLILCVTKRRFKAYGLTLTNWRETLDIGMTYALVRGIISIGIGIGPLWILGVSLPEMVDALKSGGLGIIILILILSILQKRDKTHDPDNPPSPVSNVVWLISLLLVPVFVGLYTNKLTLVVVSTVVWQFIISGFGEEILFRGYIQSRINEEFGRPFTFMGVDFGVGVIVSSLLFALGHVLNPFSPFAGHYELAWWWGVSSFVAGFHLGMVREKTGSIIPCGIAHGLPDAVGEAFILMFPFS